MLCFSSCMLIKNHRDRALQIRYTLLRFMYRADGIAYEMVMCLIQKKTSTNSRRQTVCAIVFVFFLFGFSERIDQIMISAIKVATLIGMCYVK